MAKRYAVSLPDALVEKIGDRKLPLSALLQAAIYRYLEEENDESKTEIERRLDRIERVLGLN